MRGYACQAWVCFRNDLFVRALSAEPLRGWTQLDRAVAVVGVWSVTRALCGAWHALKDFLPTGTDKTISRGFS